MFQDDNNNINIISHNPFLTQPSTHWTRLDDKLFEQALVMFPEETPDRWLKIAERVPGKSPMEVKAHYEMLLYDVCEIEAGRVEVPSYADDSFSVLSSDFDNQISFEPSKPKHHGESERKKGTPWTEDEHRSCLYIVELCDSNLELIFIDIENRLFLVGLSKFGKGDWRSISRNVVVTRTPTQVASHAQKYFLRQSSVKKERKRSSIHDITTVDSNTMDVPVDQNWIHRPGAPVTMHQFSPSSHLPAQGGSLGYQNYGFPM
ncbi:hypothetical protein CCACVL1_07222 [Corchorus capsularis]|uniref:Uncharacterized protein n=1 Tax=Corchorus capsularis TaxID=210143 RepID=A0A1R3J8A5_COCAP|nr:hypothetical protein CCACVL1_07222 [Corchorus capsularis]